VTVLVIDTDPGLDDAHALAMALTPAPHRPHHPVAAVCTVAGNHGIDTVTANARFLLGAFGTTRVPLHRGAAGPLTGEPVHATDIHGTDGLGDLTRWNVPDIPEQPTPAALALIDTARRHPGDTTLVALGPLTNLALALRLEPRLPALLDRVVVMGGAIHGRGNLTLNAEFNTAADPAAADLVLASFPRLTLLSWETTLAHTVTRAELTAFFHGPGPAATTLRRITDNRLRTDPGYARRTAHPRAGPPSSPPPNTTASTPATAPAPSSTASPPSTGATPARTAPAPRSSSDSTATASPPCSPSDPRPTSLPAPPPSRHRHPTEGPPP
jgi:purine nucleosidase